MKTQNSHFDRMFDITDAMTILVPENAVYLVAMILVMYIGKRVFESCAPYNLNEQLTTVDNKAVALAFGGYLLGLGIILSSILSGDSMVTPSGDLRRDMFKDLGNTVVWGIIGMIFLQCARLINDKILLKQFDNVKEMVTDRNVGTGAVEFGSYIGSALIINSALSGDEDVGFQASLGLAFIYFVAGQIAFIIFGKIYQLISRYDLHGEIESDNVSAGVSFGMSLIAIGILLFGYILKFESLVGLAMWFVVGVFLLITSRYIVDKLVLPGHLLDEEISNDRNWGAALVEGSAAIGVALLCIAMF